VFSRVDVALIYFVSQSESSTKCRTTRWAHKSLLNSFVGRANGRKRWCEQLLAHLVGRGEATVEIEDDRFGHGPRAADWGIGINRVWFLEKLRSRIWHSFIVGQTANVRSARNATGVATRKLLPANGMSEQFHIKQPSFVELNRRFRELDQKATAERAALESYTTDFCWRHNSLGWEDLLKESRVVVVGEDLLAHQLFREVQDPFRDHPKRNDGFFVSLANDGVQAIGDVLDVHSKSVDYHRLQFRGIFRRAVSLRLGVARRSWITTPRPYPFAGKSARETKKAGVPFETPAVRPPSFTLRQR